MKKYVLLISLLALILQVSCKPVLVVKAPPGQVKKVTGAKSAKSYAPGQMKKVAGTKSAKQFAPGQQKKKKKG
ncbi:hypothetical protein CLV24_1151 [Pontibacter ummariensis]|uniref:Quinol oxidase subunit 4 n=1 Tax=Pontibacter ummariensis TaxID=1610492 RepID=A0A239HVZ5_9BACT|nr:hypothetical protein [Pontibacter ummariensis]PRY10084.1 hypothetical protein CLV24_1151 [Pontibacter ummariensis]SNS85495.1 hypothetical protein SAMN06296052_1151 [Pontibacter ummariensis]